MEVDGVLLVGSSTIWETQFHGAPHKYIQGHGLPCTYPSTMLECGIWEPSFGHASTSDNNFMYAFIQRPRQSGMSIPFRQMPFSVVELRAEPHDQFDEASEEDEETDLNSRSYF